MNATTLEKMKQMKFFGMHRAFKTDLESGRADTYTPDEITARLTEAEWDERQNRSIEQKIKNARFRYKALLEDIYYHAERNLEKNRLLRYADRSFIRKAESILITGSTGSGKSYLASALGRHGCSMGYRVVYYSLPKLLSKLKMSKADGSYLKEVAKIERQQQLILDDFGLQPFDSGGRAALMERWKTGMAKGP